MEYKKSRQNAKRVISSAKEKKRKECANDLNDSECQREIFRMAKQMVKERLDITGLNCIKGASGKVIVHDIGIKDSWKEYMEKLTNEDSVYVQQKAPTSSYPGGHSQKPLLQTLSREGHIDESTHGRREVSFARPLATVHTIHTVRLALTKQICVDPTTSDRNVDAGRVLASGE